MRRLRVPRRHHAAAAARRPRGRDRRPDGRGGPGRTAETRCTPLQRQLDDLDDRMRAGYSLARGGAAVEPLARPQGPAAHRALLTAASRGCVGPRRAARLEFRVTCGPGGLPCTVALPADPSPPCCSLRWPRWPVASAPATRPPRPSSPSRRPASRPPPKRPPDPTCGRGAPGGCPARLRLGLRRRTHAEHEEPVPRENAITLDMHEGPRKLPLVVSASGAKYADGSITFWTKGSTATFERKGSAPVECRENCGRVPSWPTPASAACTTAARATSPAGWSRSAPAIRLVVRHDLRRGAPRVRGRHRARATRRGAVFFAATRQRADQGHRGPGALPGRHVGRRVRSPHGRRSSASETRRGCATAVQ